MNVLVTGTSRGIGLAIAQKFLAEGHRVWGVDLLPGAIEHPAYAHIQGDIREVTANVPDLAVLVNNAGTLEEADAIDVNLMGTMAFTERHIGSPALKSVLFVASSSARNGAEFPRYSASKAGLVGYMKNLALNLSRRGVTVNSVSPGGVITPANEHILQSPELYGAVKAETLLGKWAEPEEVADLVYYLSAVNRSITGEDILMDNGEQLKSNFIW
ncbi:MAG: SDR family oxidoreductase [Clostridia bacterium]|nr:SDR family oxidoreductase [Clostridia bacterium]